MSSGNLYIYKESWELRGKYFHVALRVKGQMNVGYILTIKLEMEDYAFSTFSDCVRWRRHSGRYGSFIALVFIAPIMKANIAYFAEYFH